MSTTPFIPLFFPTGNLPTGTWSTYVPHNRILDEEKMRRIVPYAIKVLCNSQFPVLRMIGDDLRTNQHCAVQGAGTVAMTHNGEFVSLDSLTGEGINITEKAAYLYSQKINETNQQLVTSYLNRSLGHPILNLSSFCAVQMAHPPKVILMTFAIPPLPNCIACHMINNPKHFVTIESTLRANYPDVIQQPPCRGPFLEQEDED